MPKARHPQLFRFTAEMHLLTDIADLVYKHIARDATVALPRPLTSVDHLSLRRRQARMNATVALFSPQHTHLTPQLSA